MGDEGRGIPHHSFLRVGETQGTPKTLQRPPPIHNFFQSFNTALNAGLRTASSCLSWSCTLLWNVASITSWPLAATAI